MSATGFLSDDVIEAIVDDRPVDPARAALVTFARQVRALGDGPAPRPSPQLAALLAGTPTAADTDLDATAPLPALATVDPIAAVDPTGPVGVTGLTGGTPSPARNGTSRTSRSQRPARSPRPMDPTKTMATPVTAGGHGRRRVAKVALGLAVATAGVAGAGAVGILPAAANDAVRSAIEAVSPVRFAEPDDAPTTSDDPRPEGPAPGDEDGTGGGTTIADDAGGADHRPDPSAADEPPGQSGDTGLTRANETPAEPHAPETTPAATAPSTVPAHGPPTDGDQAAPESVPSTVPAGGGPTDDHSLDP